MLLGHESLLRYVTIGHQIGKESIPERSLKKLKLRTTFFLIMLMSDLCDSISYWDLTTWLLLLMMRRVFKVFKIPRINNEGFIHFLP